LAYVAVFSFYKATIWVHAYSRKEITKLGTFDALVIYTATGILCCIGFQNLEPLTGSRHDFENLNIKVLSVLGWVYALILGIT
jgi:hypothetical protein